MSNCYIEYNFFMWVAPVVCCDLLQYDFGDEFRNRINNEFIKDDNNNIITLKSKNFEEYNCGLMDVDNLLTFYGCNMEHHHGKNYLKHWSIIQQTQKLFKNIV